MRTMMRYAIPVAAILIGAAGRAQAGTPLMEAVVPFPFIVNGHTMPAGKYTVERDDVASSVLVLRGEGNIIPRRSSRQFSRRPERRRIAIRR